MGGRDSVAGTTRCTDETVKRHQEIIEQYSPDSMETKTVIKRTGGGKKREMVFVSG